MRHEIIIYKNDAGQRLDKFLGKLMPDMPKNMIYKLIRKKEIRCNKKRCQGNEILQLHDSITIFADEKFFTAPERKIPRCSESEHASLQICYEDANFVIVYKPVGQDAHSGSKSPGQEYKTSLIDAVKYYLYTKQEYLPEQEQSFSPSLCNRIDRNTEGLVIAAKNASALRAMNEAIRLHQVQKSYLAITADILPKQQDTCTAWLKKDTGRNQVKILAEPPDHTWQKICTQYQVIAQKKKKQLVKINLLTGRTHQIRSHLAYLNAPLLGERKYTGTEQNHEKYPESYQCLCAYRISFTGLTSPILQYLENKSITSPVPKFVTKYFPEITTMSL